MVSPTRRPSSANRITSPRRPGHSSRRRRHERTVIVSWPSRGGLGAGAAGVVVVAQPARRRCAHTRAATADDETVHRAPCRDRTHVWRSSTGASDHKDTVARTSREILEGPRRRQEWPSRAFVRTEPALLPRGLRSRHVIRGCGPCDRGEMPQKVRSRLPDGGRAQLRRGSYSTARPCTRACPQNLGRQPPLTISSGLDGDQADDGDHAAHPHRSSPPRARRGAGQPPQVWCWAVGQRRVCLLGVIRHEER